MKLVLRKVCGENFWIKKYDVPVYTFIGNRLKCALHLLKKHHFSISNQQI